MGEGGGGGACTWLHERGLAAPLCRLPPAGGEDPTGGAHGGRGGGL